MYDFPSSPAFGDAYQTKYRWDGEKWVSTLGGAPVTPFPTLGWQTTFSKTMTAEEAGYGGYTHRQPIPFYTLAVSGTAIRITVEAGTGGSAGVSNMYIQERGAGDEYDFLSTPVPVTFDSGSSSVTVAAGVPKLSDEIAFTFDRDKSYVIAIYFGGAATLRRESDVGNSYYKGGSDAATVNASGYSLTGGRMYFIKQVEVYGPVVTSTYTAWNPSDKGANIVLSAGNLTANATAVGVYQSVRAAVGKTSGKYYFEGTYPVGSVSANLLFGIGSATASLSNYLGSDAQSGGLDGAGNIQGVGGGTAGAQILNDVISVAVDADNKTVWWRVNGGNWNGSGTPNPATNTGGKSFAAFGGAVYPMWSGGFSNGIFAVNFGHKTFSYAVPSGFTSGWPV